MKQIFLEILFLALAFSSKTSNARYSSPLEKEALAHDYKITKTWDNRTTEDGAEISIQFVAPVNNQSSGFLIKVEAPFYDDPRLPEGTPPGCYEGLWDYEVAEVFFLGPDEKYLEIELGPGGNYLVYFLEGVRNVTNRTMYLEDYSANLTQNGTRWEGVTFVPCEFLPPNMNKFNAYAIHNSDPNRVYMSLFPVSQDQNPGPDFHLLDAFEDIDLTEFCPHVGSGSNKILEAYFLLFPIVTIFYTLWS